MAVSEKKKKKLVMMTIYRKVFLKYQANAKFRSQRLPSINAIFSGGRRKRKPMGLDILLENQLGHLPKFHIYSLSRGSKLRLFLLYGQWFPRYGPIFKITIFGDETWLLAKVPEVAHIDSFYPKGSKLGLFGLIFYLIS